MSRRPPPEAAYAAALAALPGMGPARLRALLARRAPLEAWRWVLDGGALDDALGSVCRPDSEAVVGDWRRAAAVADVARGWEALAAAGVEVLLPGDDGYPAVLDDDEERPAVLFVRGRLGALQPPRVAVVGTRRCTHYGRDVARELGRDLAAAGVAVVSGLAAGIDGAAHEGALGAGATPPVGVVGSGLDVVYPRRHASLWRQVAEAGALLSEAPLGARPEPWRFPARNRIIAALSAVVVVVESHAGGGSLHTVRAAADRGIPVMAVPGSVRSPASAGTNGLLADGCAPVRDAADVLVALGLATAGTSSRPPPPPPTDPDEQRVLAAVDWTPTSLDDVLRRTGLAPGAAATLLTRLEMAGLVAGGAGWWERVGAG